MNIRKRARGRVQDESKMNKQGKTVLIVFPSQFSIGRIDKLIANIKDALRSKDVGLRDIALEKECLVFELDDVVEGAAIYSRDVRD